MTPIRVWHAIVTVSRALWISDAKLNHPENHFDRWP